MPILDPKFLDPKFKSSPPRITHQRNAPQCVEDVVTWWKPQDLPPEEEEQQHCVREGHITTCHMPNCLGQQSLAKTEAVVEEQLLVDEKWRPKANGTWQSILCWAKHARLDSQQEIAFQILSATFVLSFHDQACLVPDQDCSDLKKQKDCLEQLARRNTTVTTPLGMFASCPVRSGKGKLLLFVKWLEQEQTNILMIHFAPLKQEQSSEK